MTSPTDRYDDLRATVPDAALNSLLADLHDAYTASTPPPELRAAIKRLETQPWLEWPSPHSIGRSTQRRSHVRILAAVAILAAAIGTGAALADLDPVGQIMRWLPGGTDQRYVVDLNQARSSCGFTVTLKRAYADANRLIIGYAVGTPATRTIPSIGFTALAATDGHGKHLQPLDSAAGADLGQIVGTTRSNVQEFDTNGIHRDAMLNLRLWAPKLVGYEPITGRVPKTEACERDSAVRAVPPYKAIRSVTIPGPFVFDITIPLSPKVREASPHLSRISRYGTTVTLERIVVTPTEGRLYMRVQAGRFFWPVLHVGGATIEAASISPAGHGMWSARFFPQRPSSADGHTWVFDDHGPWIVKALTDSVHGAWRGSVTFTVTMP